MTWICLVDDDPEVCDALTEALRSAGYGVQSFRDGSDALEAIESALEPPRLLILDVILRFFSGREVVRRVRAGRRVPDVPILVITGMDIDETYFAPWSVTAVLRKPVVIERLVERVEAALRPRPKSP